MNSREILYGKNAVREALKAGRRKIFRIYGKRRDLQDIVGEREIPVVESAGDDLSRRCGSAEHQGIAAEVSPFEYADLKTIAESVSANAGFLLLLDEIQDPHNVGALLRTAHGCGAGGAVLLKHRSALVTPAVCKAAAGAEEYIPVLKETNLVDTMKFLKEKGFFLVGAEGPSGETLFAAQISFPLGLVLGSEGRGLRRLVREHCDCLLSIPMEGQIGSFNVSVAGGIFMGEILRRKRGKGPL